MQPNNKCGQRYDAEFKENAVALVKSGRTLRAVAGNLGVSTWSLRRWVAEKNNGSGLHEPKTLASETAEQREKRRLRQELEYLRRQRDILKKALGLQSGFPFVPRYNIAPTLEASIVALGEDGRIT